MKNHVKKLKNFVSDNKDNLKILPRNIGYMESRILDSDTVFYEFFTICRSISSDLLHRSNLKVKLTKDIDREFIISTFTTEVFIRGFFNNEEDENVDKAFDTIIETWSEYFYNKDYLEILQPFIEEIQDLIYGCIYLIKTTL